MNDIEIRLATCPYGHTFPIPLSKPLLEEADQKPTGMEIRAVYLACSMCGRVYMAPIPEMQIPSSTDQLPNLPDGVSLCVFENTIRCDDPNCDFQLKVIGVRRSDTSVEYEKEAPGKWRWAKGENQKCPFEHEIPWQQYG